MKQPHSSMQHRELKGTCLIKIPCDPKLYAFGAIKGMHSAWWLLNMNLVPLPMEKKKKKAKERKKNVPG